ncbi:ABC-2 family transporter protein [Inquilinus limosus]|uniref:ABC transporter permease n=1 Tax=Inquilinus limosus TaxID=171674 RepID=UPI003F1876D8
MNGLMLLGRYFTASIRSQMQYPASAIMLTFGQLASTAIEIVSIWALFDRFGAVKGWSFGEVMFFYGLVNISFSVADFVTRGFDVFGTDFVRTGDFDRLLLRPRSTALQLVGYEFRVSRFGRFLQAAAILVVATESLQYTWTPETVAVALWTIAGGTAFFVALFVLQAAMAFWTIESLEAVNALTYGGVYAGQFPLGIYARWFRTFLTFVVPLACVAYYPVLAILGRSDPLGAPDWLLPMTPAAGFAFLALSFRAWRIGVSKYMSTGS